MPEKDKNEPHRIERGPVHPAIALATNLAHRLAAARNGTVSAEEFRELFQTTATATDWSDHGINLQTAALMVATALHLQATLGQAASLMSAASPSDPTVGEASMTAQRTMQTVIALSALAQQPGVGLPHL